MNTSPVQQHISDTGKHCCLSVRLQLIFNQKNKERKKSLSRQHSEFRSSPQLFNLVQMGSLAQPRGLPQPQFHRSTPISFLLLGHFSFLLIFALGIFFIPVIKLRLTWQTTSEGASHCHFLGSSDTSFWSDDIFSLIKEKSSSMTLHKKVREPSECMVCKLSSSGNQVQRCELHMDARAKPVANSFLLKRTASYTVLSSRNVHRNQQQSTLAIFVCFCKYKTLGYFFLSQWYFAKQTRERLKKRKM